MEYTIPVVKSRYYKASLRVINSWLNLTDFELEIIATMLTHNITVLNKITRLQVRLLLDKKEETFNNYLLRLKQKKLLVVKEDGLEIHSKIIEAVKEPKITINFKITDVS